jgi:cytochrome c peroxidase
MGQSLRQSTHKTVTFASILLLVGLLSVGLALPLSNYFLTREKINDKSGDPRFGEVSKIMQTSCVDCHTEGMTSKPLYVEWPPAKDIIARDIAKAQAAFRLSRQQLEGSQSIGAIDLAKIATTIKDGTMPPRQYTLLHWGAALSYEQKQLVFSYIQDKQEDSSVALTPVMEPNPFHPDAKKALLGRKLFNDKRLSCDNTISCASCHSLTKGGCDQEAFATGIKGQKSVLNAPTVFNCAFNFCQFWDGRAKDLNDQVGRSITDPNQMGANFTDVLTRLKSDTTYSAMSQAAYGGALSEATINDAIATYEKTLLTPSASFDRYLKGDSMALSDQQKRGYQLFMEKGCASCHAGVALGGMSFEKMGVAKDYFGYREKALEQPFTNSDNGRFNVTKNGQDKHKFKVPTLRNIELTAPYFHDGTASDLTQAVAVMAEYQVGQKLSQKENADIVAFLKSLTGKYQGKKLGTGI